MQWQPKEGSVSYEDEQHTATGHEVFHIGRRLLRGHCIADQPRGLLGLYRSSRSSGILLPSHNCNFSCVIFNIGKKGKQGECVANNIIAW